jgi:ribosomal protein S6--L-glutamate ligase
LTLELGWEEWISLPDLGLPAMKAKVDTGARTSALHAFTVEPFGPANRPKVRFGVHPIPERPEVEVYCSADILDKREVTSSNGETETRYAVETHIEIAGQRWPIILTLSDREGMSFHMLLGRQALESYPEGQPVVSPTKSHVQPTLDYSAYDRLVSQAPKKRALRIAVLTKEPKIYSSQKLKEAGEARGHVVELIDTSRCYMLINAERPEVHYDGRALPSYDAVIPRIGASITSYGTAVVRQFETTGAYCLNRSDAILASRDKLYAHQILAREGIGMPSTAFASSPKDTDAIINLMSSPPIIVKLLESTQGKGVVLAETKKAAQSVISAFRNLKADFLVQEFVKEAAGEDVRCLVVGNKVVASMKRVAAAGEFRSNLHQGGSAISVRITKGEREVALRAAKALGLGFAGVDLLRSEGGPKVLEVNSSPGLEGIERSSKKDVADLVFQHIERRAISTVKRRRRQAVSA